MAKTLDETLKDVWAWRQKAMERLQGATGAERADFWKRTLQDAEELLGRPLPSRDRPRRREA